MSSFVKKGKTPPPPPSGYVPGSVPRHTTQTSSNTGIGHSPSFSAVKEMQKAILNFAAKAEDTAATNLQGKGREEGDQVTETENPNFDSSKPESAENPRKIKSNNYLGGTDPFGNFLVSNYLGDHDAVGKQYLNTDVVGSKNREDASIKDTSLKGIIDTIKRIGTPGTIGTEKAPDGIWHVRTNNALKNIYAVAYAMFHAASDMDLTLPGLNDSKLEEFKNLVPLNYTDVPANERPARAKELTALINNMALVFESFKKYVLNNKKYSKYIGQQKSFVQYKQKPQSGLSLLNDEENSLYREHMGKPIPDLKIGNTTVTLSDLESMKNFKMMMGRAGRNADDQADLAKTVAEVSKALGGSVPTQSNQTDPGY